MIENYKERAERLGVEAFKEGRIAVPALDKRLMTLLKGINGSRPVLPYLNAWLAGWHGANLNQKI